jgi:hypothetical protein
VHDAAGLDFLEERLDLRAKDWIVDGEGGRADEDELVDVLRFGVRREVAIDRVVSLLRLRVGRDLALRGEIE